MADPKEGEEGENAGFPDDADSLHHPIDDGLTSVFDYHRTVIGYHGTRRETAEALVRGASFKNSENDDDWLGHGVYFGSTRHSRRGGGQSDATGRRRPQSSAP